MYILSSCFKPAISVIQSQQLHAAVDIAGEPLALPEADRGLRDAKEAGALDLRESARHTPEFEFEGSHANSASARKRA